MWRWRVWRGGVPTGVGLLLCGATAFGGDPPVAFEDVSSVLAFEHRSVAFGGSGLGGAAWFDYDNDGDLDLFLANGVSQLNGLFRNDGNGIFTNVAEDAGVSNGLGNCGVVAADIDNDGFQDLFLTGDGGVMGASQSPAKLYHNDRKGGFVDITKSSLIVAPETALSAAFGDIDNDGFLDLFITSPGSLPGGVQHRNKLYRNNGDLTFSDISASALVDTMLGACIVFFSDWDRDGLIDIYVGDCNNVQFIPTPIELFHNNGDLTFTNMAAQAGLTPGGFWMGFGPGDYDNDGDIDIFVTNLGTAPPGLFRHALYRRNNGPNYTNVAVAAGASAHEFGWGCSMVDFDNDGFLDIFFAGSLPLPPFNIIGPGLGNPGTLLINDRAGAFDEFTSTLPVNLASLYTSGVAAGDYDNDGFVDVVVVVEAMGGKTGQPVLLRNLGTGNRSVTIDLEGTTSNRDAVGARVEVVAGSITQTREVYAGTSFLSMDSQWLTFGLGAQGGTTSVNVTWPSGLVEQFLNLPAGHRYRLVEGQGLPSCPPDLDGSGAIGTSDLLALLVQWGCDGAPDLSGDGCVGTADLDLLLFNWGSCP